MPRLINPTETQIPKLPYLPPTERLVNNNILVPRGMERVRMFPVDREGDRLAADPVACVVAIAVDEDDFYAVFEEVGEVFEPAGAGVVAYASEGAGDGAAALGPV